MNLNNNSSSVPSSPVRQSTTLTSSSISPSATTSSTFSSLSPRRLHRRLQRCFSPKRSLSDGTGTTPAAGTMAAPSASTGGGGRGAISAKGKTPPKSPRSRRTSSPGKKKMALLSATSQDFGGFRAIRRFSASSPVSSSAAAAAVTNDEDNDSGENSAGVSASSVVAVTESMEINKPDELFPRTFLPTPIKKKKRRAGRKKKNAEGNKNYSNSTNIKSKSKTEVWKRKGSKSGKKREVVQQEEADGEGEVIEDMVHDDYYNDHVDDDDEQDDFPNIPRRSLSIDELPPLPFTFSLGDAYDDDDDGEGSNIPSAPVPAPSPAPSPSSGRPPLDGGKKRRSSSSTAATLATAGTGSLSTVAGYGSSTSSFGSSSFANNSFGNRSFGSSNSSISNSNNNNNNNSVGSKSMAETIAQKAIGISAGGAAGDVKTATGAPTSAATIPPNARGAATATPVVTTSTTQANVSARSSNMKNNIKGIMKKNKQDGKNKSRGRDQKQPSEAAAESMDKVTFDDETISKDKKRQVTFCKAVRMRLSIHRNHFSDEECRSYWYTGDDIARIKQDNQLLVYTMDQGDMWFLASFLDPSDTICYQHYLGDDSMPMPIPLTAATSAPQAGPGIPPVPALRRATTTGSAKTTSSTMPTTTKSTSIMAPSSKPPLPKQPMGVGTMGMAVASAAAAATTTASAAVAASKILLPSKPIRKVGGRRVRSSSWGGPSPTSGNSSTNNTDSNLSNDNNKNKKFGAAPAPAAVSSSPTSPSPSSPYTSTTFCTRGLEGQTKQGTKRRNLRKRQVQKAVFWVQYKQQHQERQDMLERQRTLLLLAKEKEPQERRTAGANPGKVGDRQNTDQADFSVAATAAGGTVSSTAVAKTDSLAGTDETNKSYSQEEIARACQEHSQESAYIARQLGLVDEQWSLRQHQQYRQAQYQIELFRGLKQKNTST